MLKILLVKLKTLHFSPVFNAKKKYSVENINLFHILDGVFHTGKKKPLQLFFRRKGFYFTFLLLIFVDRGCCVVFFQLFYVCNAGADVSVFEKRSHFVLAFEYA